MIVETLARSVHAWPKRYLIAVTVIGMSALTGSRALAQSRPASEMRPHPFPVVKAPPTDASRADAELTHLKETLLAAARAKSVAMLEPVMTDEFRLGLHEVKKRDDAIREMSNGKGAGYPNFWRDLENALTHGLALIDPEFAVAPYGTVQPGKCEFSPHHYCAVIMGTGVMVRTAPRSSAPVVAVVSNEMVGLIKPGTIEGKAELIGRHRYRWIQIATSSGKVGFVSEKFAAEDLGLTFQFKKEKGRWRFAGMTSGD